MNRTTALIERMQEPDAREILWNAKERHRAQWRKRNALWLASHPYTHIPAPRVSRHRWTELQLHRAFVTSEEPCQNCGSRDRLTVSHVVAVADGGTYDLSNIEWLCRRCHLEHHDV